jgi:hypothetical protein
MKLKRNKLWLSNGQEQLVERLAMVLLRSSPCVWT